MTTTWVAILGLGSLLAWLERRRPDRRHRHARAVLVLLAALALGALLEPPSLPVPGLNSGTVILQTPGADEPLLREARDSFPGARVAIWPDPVRDLSALRRLHPEARRVVVVGWGLRAGWWEGQDSIEVRFMPGRSPDGFQALQAPGAVRLGEEAVIAGSIRGATDSAIVLEGPDGARDTVFQNLAGAGRFEFRVAPAAAGQVRYQLSAAGVLGETVSIAVLPPRPPAVLVVESAPSFETTFLRRWLASQGGRMAIRTQLSLDRYRSERINLADQPLRPLRPELLAEFDLVLIDGPTLRSLTPAERGALGVAIREGGLGLLVAPDSVARQDREFFPFTLRGTGELEERRVRPRWAGQRDGSTTAIPAAPFEIEPAAGLTALGHDPVGRILAASRRIGLGRTATTLLTASSRWQLEGETGAYADYWSRLYRAAARGQGDRWEVAADGPIAEHHAVDIGLTTDDPAPRVTIRAPDGSVDTVGIAQDLADPARWWGRFWPRMTGWHEATNQGGSAYLLDVASARPSALEANSRLHATRIRAATSIALVSQDVPRSRQPLAPLIPFLVLVAALGALWAEGRGLWDRILAARHRAPSSAAPPTQRRSVSHGSS